MTTPDVVLKAALRDVIDRGAVLLAVFPRALPINDQQAAAVRSYHAALEALMQAASDARDETILRLAQMRYAQSLVRLTKLGLTQESQ